MSIIKEKLLEYKGLNPYLKILKKFVEQGQELSSAQNFIAEKLLTTNAIKTQNRDALPLPEIKQFTINWDKYSSKPPFQFQKEGVNWLLNKKYAILGDDMGCIDGNALISINRANEEKKIKLKELYFKFNGLNGKWNKNIPTYASCVINNVFYKRKISGVYYKGKKKVLKITLEDGKELKATYDHLFLRENNKWEQLQNLKIGDKILTNETSICFDCSSNKDLTTYHYNKSKIKKVISKVLEIVNIEEVNDKIDVYDISVEESHNFIANEIIVHNCGKTLQAIIASIELQAKKTLIVCPNSLKINWAKELEYFVSKCDITIIKKDYIKPTKFTIINYEKLKKYNEQLIKEKFDIVISDECHLIKSGRGSLRGKYFFKITNKVPRIWLLTGTPITNRPIDFFNLLKVCRHDLGRRKYEYAQHYCGNLMTNWGWDTKGASNLKELYFRTQDVILRRLKKDVLDLPPKQRVPIYLEMSASRLKAMERYVSEKFQDIYNGMNDPNSEHFGKNIEKGEKFIKLAANRMFCAIEKIKDSSVQELVESCQDAGKKVIIFTNYIVVADEYKAMFGDDAVILDGRVKIEERQRIIDDFQINKGPSIMICNFKIGSVGINLTSAEVEVINDLPWEPATLTQAEDRCIIKGQVVLTNSGYKKIEEIQVGELVFTHLGNWKKVTNVWSSWQPKKLKVDIKCQGYNNLISTTHDHQYYVYNIVKKEFEWIEAFKILPKTHFLTFPAKLKKRELKKITIENEYSNYNLVQKIGRQIQLGNNILVTDNFLYAIGTYVGDGWVNLKKNGEPLGIGVCGNLRKEKKKVLRVISDLSKTFNVGKVKWQEKKNCCQGSLGSKNLGYLFKKWCGETSHSKQFPDWVYNLSSRQINVLLKGYYDADGYYCKFNNQVSGVTVSSKLASQLLVLGSMTQKNMQFNKRVSKGNSFNGNKEFSFYSLEYSISKNPRIKIKNNYLLYPVTSVTISKFAGEKCYDLTVEDDNSFIIGVASVHNCFRIGQTKKIVIYFPIYIETIDEVMFHSIKAKINNIDIAINGKEGITQFQHGSVINEVYEMLKKQKKL